MSDAANRIVQKLWSYCKLLRDDGLSYQDYLEQLTFLLFLNVADEPTRLTGEPQPIPGRPPLGKSSSRESEALRRGPGNAILRYWRTGIVRNRSEFILVLTLSVLVACRTNPVIDLRCDMMEWPDGERGADVVRIAPGVDSMLAAHDLGRWVFLFANRADSAGISDVPTYVSVRSEGARYDLQAGIANWHNDSLATVVPVDARAGIYHWRAVCRTCWPASGVDSIRAGRVDTFRLFLGRARQVCDPPI